MSAPKDNKNALKQQAGLQISFYLSAIDAAYIKRRLMRELNREPTRQEISKFARDKAKNGVWSAIKSEMDAIII